VTTDKSLRTKGSLLRRRNVLSREERLRVLEREGKWEEGQSVFGLPKVTLRVRKARKKKAKEAPVEAGAEALAEGADTDAEARAEDAPAS